MTWEDKYREAHDDARDHMASLQAKIAEMERREHRRKTRNRTWLVIIALAIVAFEVWQYSH